MKRNFSHRFYYATNNYLIQNLLMLSLLNPQDLIKNHNNFSSRSRSKSRECSSKIVSNYEIHQKLGRGSYARVFKAVHLPTKEIVAVKVFSKSKLNPEEIQDVKREVEIHKKLQHSNIARIYEFYEDQRRIYIFMEYCPNGQLFTYINEKGPMSEKNATKVFKQILSAIKYLKSQRIFHRDIKCENILFDKNMNAKLVDFGFATKEQDETFSRTFCGSPSYTAPQLFTKTKYKAEMIDVWCLGITFYAILVGTLPFDGKQYKNTKKNIMEFKYKLPGVISSRAEEIFKLIFVEDFDRASIEDIEETDFVKNSPAINENFINTNIEQITIDPQVMESIQAKFPEKSSTEIIESVTQFRLDENYALYYLMVQNCLSKSKSVKYDIASPCFEKRKKKLSNIRLRKLSQNFQKNPNSEKKPVEIVAVQIQDKKTKIRIRPSLASINLDGLRIKRRNNSEDSPSKKLPSTSRYNC